MLQLILSHFTYTDKLRFQMTHYLKVASWWILDAKPKVVAPELLTGASFFNCLNAKEKKLDERR